MECFAGKSSGARLVGGGWEVSQAGRLCSLHFREEGGDAMECFAVKSSGARLVGDGWEVSQAGRLCSLHFRN